MHHKATVSASSDPKLPVHIQCACGTAGNFPSEPVAIGWMQIHFRRLADSLMDTTELVSSAAPPVDSASALTGAESPAPFSADAGEGSQGITVDEAIAEAKEKESLGNA